MPAETRPPTSIFLRTAITVVIAGIIGAAGGIYLGRHYQPRVARDEIARQPPADRGQPPVSPPATLPAAAPHRASAPAVKGAPPPSAPL